MLNSFPLGTPNVAYACELETKRRKFRRRVGGAVKKIKTKQTKKNKVTTSIILSLTVRVFLTPSGRKWAGTSQLIKLKLQTRPFYC